MAKYYVYSCHAVVRSRSAEIGGDGKWHIDRESSAETLLAETDDVEQAESIAWSRIGKHPNESVYLANDLGEVFETLRCKRFVQLQEQCLNVQRRFSFVVVLLVMCSVVLLMTAIFGGGEFFAAAFVALALLYAFLTWMMNEVEALVAIGIMLLVVTFCVVAGIPAVQEAIEKTQVEKAETNGKNSAASESVE